MGFEAGLARGMSVGSGCFGMGGRKDGEGWREAGCGLYRWVAGG